MPRLLSPEEFDSEFGGGFRAAAPEAGLGTRFGAAVDRTQGSLLGIGEAVGLPLGDLRRQNQAEADASMQRYFRDNPYEPQSFRDVNSVGSGLRYLRGLAIDSAPALGGTLAGGVVGGIPGAFAVGATLGTGDVLDNQREQAGQTNLLTALPLGAAYGAIDALTGVGGALARRSVRSTGLRALDEAGTKALDNIGGFKGGLARTGVQVGKQGFVEGVGETGQEVINQLGRRGVDADVGLLDPDAQERYLESFVGGAALGGAFGGAMGGWRRSANFEPRTVDQGQFDLTQPGGGAPQTPAPDYNLVTQPDPLQDRINMALGIQRSGAPKNYAQQFEQAAAEGSGQVTIDPNTGVEVPLDMGQYYARQAGLPLNDVQAPAPAAPAAPKAQPTPREVLDQTATQYGGKPIDIGGQKAYEIVGGRVYGQSTFNQILTELAVANQAMPEGQRVIEQALVNSGLVNFDGKPVGTSKQIANKIKNVRKGLNLSEAESPEAAAAILNDQIAQLVAKGKNEADPTLGKLAVAYEALTLGQTPPALASQGNTVQTQPETKNAAPAVSADKPAPAPAAPAGQSSPTGQRAATSTGDGSPVVQRSVADTGSVPDGNAGVDRNAGGAGAGSQQTGAPASAASEQPAPVTERKTLTVRKSTVPSNPFSVTEDTNDDLEIARLTGNANELEAQAQEDAGQRIDDPLAGDKDAQNAAIDAILAKRFGDTEEGQRQAKVAKAYLTALKVAPRGSKIKMQEAIGKAFGIKPVTVRAYGNTTELVAAGKALGYTEQQVRDLLEIDDNSKAKQAQQDTEGMTPEELEQRRLDDEQRAIETALNQRNDVQLEEGEQDSGLAADGPRGKMSDASMTSQIAGEFGDSAEEGDTLGFGMDDSNTWKLANVRSGAGDLDNARAETYANAVQVILDRIDGIRETIDELEQQGLFDAVEQAQQRIAEEEAALQQAMAAYEEFLKKDQAKQREAEAAKETKAEKPKKAKAEKAPAAETPAAPAVPAVSPGEKVWNDLRKQMTDLVPYDQLTATEQGYLTELAERTNGKPVVAKEVGLQQLLTRTAEPEVQTTDEQRKAAQAHADDLGGVVAWQEGDMALIRGYSLLTGQPVYAFARGGSRSRVDVESFTGDALSAEDKARLVAIKQQLEEADAQAHATSPFIKFDSNGLATSKSVDPRLAGVMAGWKNLLGVKANIYVTTIDDARADKDKFTGPHRAIGSAALDANEAGSMRRMGDGYYIAFKKGTSYMKMLETLGHELGHVHQREAFDNAPAELQKQIRAEHDKFIAENAKKTGREFVQALRARATGRATKGVDNMPASELSSYWKSFSEWYADQVSKWATTSEKPVGVVEQFFSRLAQAIKKFYYSLKGEKYLPNETMKQFLDAIADRTIVIDSKAAATQDTRAEQMFVGEKSLTNLTEAEKDKLTFSLIDALEMRQDRRMDGQKIWEKTGWALGPDNKWRYWLSDDGASMKKVLWESFPQDTKMPLTDVIDHPELFRRYPKLRQYQVVRDSTLRPGGGALRGTIIHVGAETYPDFNAFEHSPLGVLLHEIQHGVQDIEGFTSGGSTTSVDPYNPVALRKMAGFLTGTQYAKQGEKMLKSLDTLDKLVTDLEQADFERSEVMRKEMDKGLTIAQAKNAPGYKSANRRVEALESERDRLVGSLFSGINFTEEDVRHLMYTLISGEIEARETASRFENPARQGLNPYAYYPRKYHLMQSRWGYAESRAPEGTVVKTINQLPKEAREPVSNIWRNLNRWSRKGLDRVVFTTDLLNRAKDAGIGSATKFQRLLEERGAFARDLEIDAEGVADLYAAVPEKERGTGPDSVNQFIFDSTREGKWGYNSGSMKADADMAQRFDVLSEESRRFVQAVFDHGAKMLALKKQTVIDSTNSIYDGLIAKETDPKAKAKLERDKAADLAKFQRLFAIREGLPYAPIKRVGNYVVIAKSRDYKRAEEAGDEKTLRQLEKDPDHYHVSFMESENQAVALATQLEDQGFFKGEIEYAEKEQMRDRLFGGESMLNAITKLKGMVDAQIDDDTSAKEKQSVARMQRLVSDLYLQTLAENSARKTEMRRRGVAGEVDMLKSFTMQGQADAQFLASVKYASPTQAAIQEMRKQVKAGPVGTRNRRSELFNEIMARYIQTLDFTPTPTADKISRVASIWYLATSPAYYLQNLTQPFMMSLPVMSGRHDYTSSANALLKAYGEIAPLIKSTAKAFNQQIQYEKLPADVRGVIQELVKRGRVDIGIDTELGKFQVEGDSKLGAGWNKVDKFLRSASQKLEAVNRLSTAIAAYRLELAKSGDKAKATEYADRILTETHGDYTRFNAPRAFNTALGKVALQFRKFQLIQLTLLAKLFKDAGFSTAEKRAATKSLALVLGHTVTMAGVSGLPGYAAVSWLLGALLGDDDDKFDLTQELRKLIGDEDVATLILKGAPARAGVDLSGKLGMGNALSILPYNEIKLGDRDSLMATIGALISGPAGGLAGRAMDGIGLIANGDYYKGLEMLMPTGLANMMKAYRIGNEGVTRRNGDLVMSPEEVSFAESVAQALGFTPTDQAVRSERANYVREVNQGFQDRSSEIKNAYAKAVREKDAEAKAQAREDWKRLQQARKEKGYTPKPLSELLKAPQQAAKREKSTLEGVPFNKQNRRFVQELVEN